MSGAREEVPRLPREGGSRGCGSCGGGGSAERGAEESGEELAGGGHCGVLVLLIGNEGCFLLFLLRVSWRRRCTERERRSLVDRHLRWCGYVRKCIEQVLIRLGGGGGAGGGDGEAETV